jgi:hypothetical protein
MPPDSGELGIGHAAGAGADRQRNVRHRSPLPVASAPLGKNPGGRGKEAARSKFACLAATSPGGIGASQAGVYHDLARKREHGDFRSSYMRYGRNRRSRATNDPEVRRASSPGSGVPDGGEECTAAAHAAEVGLPCFPAC